MTQRVNIQYSIDIEQLPQEVSRLTKNIDTKLNTVGNTKLSNAGNKKIITLDSVKQIVELRLFLAEVDHNLMDIENIMNGYIRFLSSPVEDKTAADIDPRPTEEVYPDEEILDDLETKIRNFKETLTENKSPNDQNTTKKHKHTKQVSRPNT